VGGRERPTHVKPGKNWARGRGRENGEFSGLQPVSGQTSEVGVVNEILGDPRVREDIIKEKEGTEVSSLRGILSEGRKPKTCSRWVAVGNRQFEFRTWGKKVGGHLCKL